MSTVTRVFPAISDRKGSAYREKKPREKKNKINWVVPAVSEAQHQGKVETHKFAVERHRNAWKRRVIVLRQYIAQKHLKCHTNRANR